MNHLDVIREYCLAKPDVEETLPFGPNVLVYKVKGKVFLLLSLDADPLRFNVKCDPERALELRERFDYVQPGYHMNKKHWNTVVLDGRATTVQVREWVDHSYSLVAKTKK